MLLVTCLTYSHRQLCVSVSQLHKRTTSFAYLIAAHLNAIHSIRLCRLNIIVKMFFFLRNESQTLAVASRYSIKRWVSNEDQLTVSDCVIFFLGVGLIAII